MLRSLRKAETDYNKYLDHTPGNGGEYYVLHIPKEITPPKEGQKLILNDNSVVVQSVSTPDDIAKGRGGPTARSMEKNGIGWSVNCLPEGHKWLEDRYDMGLNEEPDEVMCSLRSRTVKGEQSVMRIKMTEKNFSEVNHKLSEEPESRSEIFEVEGNNLIEGVAKINEMPVSELESLIKSGEWQGGEWKQLGPNKLQFDSDVFTTTFEVDTEHYSSLNRRDTMEVQAKKGETQQTDWGPIKEGKFTDWCKKRGYKSVNQTCINEAIGVGGHAAKMANFAINASKGKYKHPKKKEKKAELLGQLVRLADVLDQKGLVDEVAQLDTVIKEVSQDTSYESTGEPVQLEDFVEQIIGEPLVEETVAAPAAVPATVAV